MGSIPCGHLILEHARVLGAGHTSFALSFHAWWLAKEFDSLFFLVQATCGTSDSPCPEPCRYCDSVDDTCNNVGASTSCFLSGNSGNKGHCSSGQCVVGGEDEG